MSKILRTGELCDLNIRGLWVTVPVLSREPKRNKGSNSLEQIKIIEQIFLMNEHNYVGRNQSKIEKAATITANLGDNVASYWMQKFNNVKNKRELIEE